MKSWKRRCLEVAQGNTDKCNLVPQATEAQTQAKSNANWCKLIESIQQDDCDNLNCEPAVPKFTQSDFCLWGFSGNCVLTDIGSEWVVTDSQHGMQCMVRTELHNLQFKICFWVLSFWGTWQFPSFPHSHLHQWKSCLHFFEPDDHNCLSDLDRKWVWRFNVKCLPVDTHFLVKVSPFCPFPKKVIWHHCLTLKGPSSLPKHWFHQLPLHHPLPPLMSTLTLFKHPMTGFRRPCTIKHKNCSAVKTVGAWKFGSQSQIDSTQEPIDGLLVIGEQHPKLLHVKSLVWPGSIQVSALPTQQLSHSIHFGSQWTTRKVCHSHQHLSLLQKFLNTIKKWTPKILSQFSLSHQTSPTSQWLFHLDSISISKELWLCQILSAWTQQLQSWSHLMLHSTQCWPFPFIQFFEQI